MTLEPECLRPGSDGGGTSGETESANCLKALGNASWQRQEYQAAVDLWNRALRRYVEELDPESTVTSDLGPAESCRLERSLYLNLAQGYLKTGEPRRASRACQVVLQDSPHDVKALYRAAEASLLLQDLDDSCAFLNSLLQAHPDHSEASKMLKRVKALQRAAQREEKEAARRMCKAATGYSDGRTKVETTPSWKLAHLAEADPAAMVAGVEVADAAAKAGRERAHQLQERALPVPCVSDLDTFRAKVFSKTAKMNKSVDASLKARNLAQRSAKLAWLREGRQSEGFKCFESEMRKELREIEACDETVSESTVAIAAATCVAEMD